MPPADDSQIAHNRNPTPKSDRLLEANFARHPLNLIHDMKDDREMFSYKLTAFGHALIEYVTKEAVDLPESVQNLTQLAARIKDAQNS